MLPVAADAPALARVARTGPACEADGSPVISIRHQGPGKAHLMLRLCWPTADKPSLIDGSWMMPAVERA